MDPPKSANTDAEWKQSCREHWESQLGSSLEHVRIASAWGLLTLDRDHAAAVEVISAEGDEEDRERLRHVRERTRTVPEP